VTDTREPIYVASRAIPERVAMWLAMREQGFNVTSTWINEAGPGETASFPDLWQRIIAEIGRSSRFVLYAETQDFPLKGALVEAGAAIALGKPVICVLPGVVLEPRNMRPLGSWAQHPLVTLCQVWPEDLVPWMAERRAPVQGIGDGRSITPTSRPPGTVPWLVHMQAFEAYARHFGLGQSAERLAERGGFSYGEMQCLLAGHSPIRSACGEHPAVPGWMPRTKGDHK